MNPFGGSLRTKIIAWSFVPTTIILVAVALVTFFAYQRVTEELVIERDRDVARLSAGQLATELAEYTVPLAALARNSDIYRGDPTTQRGALKRAGNRLAVFDAGVVILDVFGTVTAAEPVRSEALGQDWSDRTCYRELLRSSAGGASVAAFSNIVADGPQGADAVCVAVPITGDQGEFLGAMLGMFRIGATAVSAFYGDIVKLRVGESGSAYLVDGNGRVIYHSNANSIGANLATQEVVQRVLSGQTDAVRTRDSEGADIVASFAPVSGTPWGLVIEESWATLTSASRGYQQFLLLLLALGIVVPILFVTVGVRRITRPIGELIGAAQEVARGNFGRTITARTGDEVEELSRQFNLMSAQLKASYAHLEQRVADRTRELAALNAIAATVSQSLDLAAVLDDALDETLQVMGIEAGGIYLLDKKAGVLTVAAQRGFSPQFVAEIDGLKMGEGFSGRVAQSGQPLVVRNVSADPRLTRMIVQEEELRSLAVVPLSSKGEVLGTLFALTHGYREFTAQDVQLLTSIGHQIGVAVENARFFEAERHRAEQFRVISEVGRGIISILAVDELLDQMARLIQEAFDYHLVRIGLIEGDELVFKTRAGREQDSDFQSFRLNVDRQSVTGWVAVTGEPLLVPDVSQEPRYVRVTATQTRSELAVPIKVKEKIIGVLNVESECLNAFDESDVAVLQSLANQAAIVIENARLFEAEQRRAEQFRVIGEVGRRITSILDIDEVLVQVVRLIQEAFNYDHVGIALIEGDEAVYKHGTGRLWHDPQFQFRPGRLKIGQEGITGWVAGTGEPLLVPDVGQDPRYVWMQGSKTRSELAVPIKGKGKVIGVLDAQSECLNAFDESDLTMLQSLASQAGIAIENARLYEQARQLAVLEERNRLARDLHDAVTQTLFSASLIAEALPALWERDHEEGRQLLQELRQLSRGALAEMRTLLLELRPAALVETGLGDLLRQLAEAITGRTGLPVTVTVEGRCVPPAEVHVALYRVAQEALNNVVKHAHASQVRVSLRCYPHTEGKRIELRVSDDGRGFDPQGVSPDHLGLGIMRERAQTVGATLSVASRPGDGTEVVLVWQEGEQPTTNDR